MIEPNFDDDSFEIKNERAWWRRLAVMTFGSLGLIAIVVGLVFFFAAHSVKAAPVAEAGGQGVVITLTDEPCVLKAVSNLKQRATWTENNRLTEGCWATGGGLVMLYFADLTVLAVPAGVFQRVVGV